MAMVWRPTAIRLWVPSHRRRRRGSLLLSVRCLDPISPTPTPHVRPPPTLPRASPPAPHRVHIHVPPVTRTSLPLSLSNNMLPQVEMPTKHVASPSNTALNDRTAARSPFDATPHTRTLPRSHPPVRCQVNAPPALTVRTGVRPTPFRFPLLL